MSSAAKYSRRVKRAELGTRTHAHMSNDFIERVREFSGEMVSYTADHVPIN
ncbi:uncharacterized protein METZ01_LOCUS60126, partial [marine metagenome]